jgi:hypothetical protein
MGHSVHPEDAEAATEIAVKLASDMRGRNRMRAIIERLPLFSRDGARFMGFL